MSRKYTYHRENCDCFIREIIVDVYGRRIVLGGQHAFEYSITVISITGRTNDGFIHILISRLTIKPTLSLYHI